MPRLRVLTSAPIVKTVQRWPGIPGYWNGSEWILEKGHVVASKNKHVTKKKIVNNTTRKVIEGDIKRSIRMGMKLCEQKLTPEVEKEINKIYGKTSDLIKRLKVYNASYLFKYYE